MSLSLLAACGGGSSSPSNPAPVGNDTITPTVTASITSTTLAPGAPILGTILTTSIVSTKIAPTGVSYPINIYMPADYATTGDKLPVIYSLDGGNDNAPRFETMVRIMEEQNARAILVGIGNFGRREIDYRLPGASTYYDFLTSELIPSVESKYRIDSASRILTGHSYGGLFTFLALTMDRPERHYFSTFISLDGSFWYQSELTQGLEQKMFAATSGKLPGTTLVLSSGAHEGNETSVESTYRSLLERNYEGLVLQRLPGYDANHLGMFTPGFTDSIRFVFKK